MKRRMTEKKKRRTAGKIKLDGRRKSRGRRSKSRRKR